MIVYFVPQLKHTHTHTLMHARAQTSLMLAENKCRVFASLNQTQQRNKIHNTQRTENSDQK
jgi:hypothetical protein